MSYNGYHFGPYGIETNETYDDVPAQIGKIVIATILLIAFVFVCYWVITTLNGYICKANADQMGFECDYSIITGCKIKLDNGHYINIDKYRGLD